MKVVVGLGNPGKEYDKTTADGVFCEIGRFWY